MMYFAIGYGLTGCSIPDHVSYYEVNGIRELSSIIKDELSFLKMPRSLFREVKINRLSKWMKRHGCTRVHVCLVYKNYTMYIQGLTEDEYNSSVNE